MRVTDRRDRIVELLLEHQRLSVEELAHRLDTSQETIRRDLTALHEQNRLRKFHGGAALPDSVGEGAFRLRMVEQLEAKRAIARRAAGLFAPGDTLFIDTGSTTIAFAGELAQRTGLTVITNAVGIAQLMTRGGGNQVFLLGGEHRHEAGENVGPMVLRQIADFRPAHAVLTVGALLPEGPADFDAAEAEIARAMIAQAESVTLLADSTKFTRQALFPLCDMPRVTRIVTDKAPVGALAAALDAAGVELILAPGGN